MGFERGSERQIHHHPPSPCLGRIDQAIEGLPQKELQRCLEIIKEKVTPNFDITPQVLTHWHAYDLDKGEWTRKRENEWSFEQNAETLTRYIAFATEILSAADFVATGITSPWDFGRKVEDAYSEAVGRALKELYRFQCSWYFLHTNTDSLDVEPRITFQKEGIRVWSVIATTPDCFWVSQNDGEPDIDSLLSPDGGSGRIKELISAR